MIVRLLELHSLIQSMSEATKAKLLDSIQEEGADPVATAKRTWDLITKLIKTFNNQEGESQATILIL